MRKRALALPQKQVMDNLGQYSSNKPALSSVSSAPTSRLSVDTALGETIKALRELEQICFRSSRNSPLGLFYGQQRLLITRISFGKSTSRSDWLRLAELGQRASTGKAA